MPMITVTAMMATTSMRARPSSPSLPIDVQIVHVVDGGHRDDARRSDQHGTVFSVHVDLGEFLSFELDQDDLGGVAAPQVSLQVANVAAA